MLAVFDSQAPQLQANDQTITTGDHFAPLSGVTANDKVDGNLTNKISVKGSVDTSKAGTYKLTYKVHDNSGNKTSLARTITVVEPAPAESNQPTTVQTPVATQTSTAVQSNPTSQTTTVAPAGYAPMTMTLAGTTLSYQNGGQGSGQAIIDANPSTTVSTWGGAASYSGNDGLNTHFIGHNPGAFNVLFSLGAGSPIVVTDGNGNTTTYTVTSILTVDDYAVDVNTGTDYWDTITGTGGGERITLQTCINDTTNRIIIAQAN